MSDDSHHDRFSSRPAGRPARDSRGHFGSMRPSDPVINERPDDTRELLGSIWPSEPATAEGPESGSYPPRHSLHRARPVRESDGVLGSMWEPGLPGDVSPQIEIFDVEPGIFGVAYYKCLTFGLWSGRADLPAVKRVAQLGKHMRMLYPDGHTNVTFVRSGCPLPADEVRPVYADMYSGKVSKIRCMSVILEGEGFWASALRAMITELRHRHHYVAGSHSEVRIDGSVLETAQWLAPAHTRVTGWGITAVQMATICHHAHSALVEAVEGNAGLDAQRA